MSRRRRRADQLNPQRAARHRKETKRLNDRLNYRATWTLLVVFDVVVTCYSVGHYLSTGHREVFANAFLVVGVTVVGVMYLPRWE